MPRFRFIVAWVNYGLARKVSAKMFPPHRWVCPKPRSLFFVLGWTKKKINKNKHFYFIFLFRTYAFISPFFSFHFFGGLFLRFVSCDKDAEGANTAQIAQLSPARLHYSVNITFVTCTLCLTPKLNRLLFFILPFPFHFARNTFWSFFSPRQFFCVSPSTFTPIAFHQLAFRCIFPRRAPNKHDRHRHPTTTQPLQRCQKLSYSGNDNYNISKWCSECSRGKWKADMMILLARS